MGFDQELAVRITGDTSALQAATKRGSEEMKLFAREALQAAKVVEASLSPTEQLAQKQDRLNHLMTQGHLSAEQHTRATKKLADEFARATGVTQQREQAMRAGEALTRKMETAEERLSRELKDVNQLFSQGAISAQTHKRAIDQLKTSTESTAKAFDGGQQKLMSYAAQLGSVGTLVGALRSGLQGLEMDAQRGLASIQQNQAADQMLSQVATSGTDLDRLFSQSDRAAVAYGMDRDAARRLRFSARSEGFDASFMDVANAGQLVGTDAAGTIAGQFRSLFRGRENLSTNQAISATLAAAGGSRLNFQQIAEASPAAAETAASAGTTSSELLASLSVLSSRFKSGLTAGDRLKAFQSRVGQLGSTGTQSIQAELQSVEQQLESTFDVAEIEKLQKKRDRLKGDLSNAQAFSQFQGKGILGSFQLLQGMTAEQRQEALGGSVEVKAVYDALQADADMIRERRAQIESDMAATSQGGGMLRRQLAIQGTSENFLAARQARVAEVQGQIVEEQEARDRLARQAAFRAGRNEMADDPLQNFVGAAVEATGQEDLIMRGLEAADSSPIRNRIRSLGLLGLLAGSIPSFNFTEAGREDLRQQVEAAKQTAEVLKRIETKLAPSPTVVDHID